MVDSPASDRIGAERRGSPRRPITAHAELAFAGQVLGVRTRDISGTGIGLLSSSAPSTGETAQLFMAPSSHPLGNARIVVDVVIVRADDVQGAGASSVGVQFNRLSPAAEDLVRRHLRALGP